MDALRLLSSMRNMKLSPIVLAGLGFVLALAGLAMALLISISPANVGFKAEVQGDAIVISEVSSWLKDSGISEGDLIQGFRSENGYAALQPGHLRLGLGADKQKLWGELQQIRNVLG